MGWGKVYELLLSSRTQLIKYCISALVYGAGGLKAGSRKQLTIPNTTSYQAEGEKSDPLPDRQCYKLFSPLEPS